jgi:hypothetical protein
MYPKCSNSCRISRTESIVQWRCSRLKRCSGCGINMCRVMKCGHVGALWWMHIKLAQLRFGLSYVMSVQGKKYGIYMYVKPNNSFTNKTNKKTNSVALSPRANYADWGTTTCRRNLVPTFVDRGVSRGQRGGSPTAVNFSFLDRSCYFSFKYSSFTLTRAEWTPFQTYCYSENVVAPEIEPGTSGLAARNSWLLDHRDGLFYEHPL